MRLMTGSASVSRGDDALAAAEAPGPLSRSQLCVSGLRKIFLNSRRIQQRPRRYHAASPTFLKTEDFFLVSLALLNLHQTLDSI